MNTLAFEPRARKVSFDADNMWAEFADGRQLGVPLAYFPSLLNAGRAQREGYIISGGGTGLHWDELDEDPSNPCCGAWVTGQAPPEKLHNPPFSILSRPLKLFSKTFLLEKDKKGYILTGLTQVEKPGVGGFDLKYGFIGV